jgi:hypothetical protein
MSKKRTLLERAELYWSRYLWGFDTKRNIKQAWIAGYRAAKRATKGNVDADSA